MAVERWCICWCHRHPLGDIRDAMQRGDFVEADRLSRDPSALLPHWAHVEDAMEAAVASGCACIVNHTPALASPKKPPYKPPTNWTPDATGDSD